MRIEIDVERLVVEGLDLSHRERRDLQRSIEVELTLLLSHRASARDVVRRSTGSLSADAGYGPRIAGAVHRAITAAPALSGLRGESR